MVHRKPSGTPAPTEAYRQSVIDLSGLPLIMSPKELAPVLGITPDALAQDRYLCCGIPYVRLGRRIRYLRDDVVRHLAAHRVGGSGDAV